MNSHNCRVCGLYIEELPWGASGDTPTYEICPCCGVEFGYEDLTVESTKNHRERWLTTGAKWFTPKDKPDGWDLEKQLLQIPYSFK